MKVSDIERKTGKRLRQKTLSEALSFYMASRINIVGVVASGARKKGLLESHFLEDSRLIALVRKEDLEHVIHEDDAIVYLANSRADILRAVKNAGNEQYQVMQESQLDDMRLNAEQMILLVGNPDRCAQIQSEIEHYGCNVRVVLISRDECHNFCQSLEGRLDDCENRLHFHTIAVLSETENVNASPGTLDAKTIVTANLVLKKVLEYQSTRPRVVAEMMNVANRRLFADAGVDIIIPEAILVERLMAKLVYNKGLVSDFFMALLSTQDKTHFSSRIARTGDGYCGKTFRESTSTHTVGKKLIAWLPAKHIDALKNKEEDFDTHFVMVPNDQYTDEVIAEGDELVFIVSGACGRCQ
jgi:hypothetical protein